METEITDHGEHRAQKCHPERSGLLCLPKSCAVEGPLPLEPTPRIGLLWVAVAPGRTIVGYRRNFQARGPSASSAHSQANGPTLRMIPTWPPWWRAA